jgi:hypothetical protein
MDAPLPPTGDPDQDGLATAQDNCPLVSNRNQANEDGDALGDACDPCPPVAGMNANSDSDGDGVGNACDPNPNIGGDRLLVFEGFSDPTTITPGFTSLGSWSYVNGTAMVSAPQTQAAWLKWSLNPVPARTTVRAAGAIANLFSTAGVPLTGAGVLEGESASQGGGTVCVIGYETAGTPTRLLLARSTGGSFAGTGVTGVVLGQPQEFELARLGAGGGHRCTATPASPNPATASITTGPGAGTGLWAQAADAGFAWVMIVGSP